VHDIGKCWLCRRDCLRKRVRSLSRSGG
jgi:hypothetical protein